jgi:hypothetical protein
MYKNFKITEEERQQILESHMSHGYKKPLNEGFGMTWLTKIKVDSPTPQSEEEMISTAKNFGSSFNGLVAVEFGPGVWFNSRGEKIDDIDQYEKHVENNIYNSDGQKSFRDNYKDSIQSSRRNTEPDEPHIYKYKSFDDYQNK